MAIAAVLQVSLNVMFVATGLFAVAVVITSWRKAAPAIAALGREIALLESELQSRREVRFQIAATGSEVASAQPIPPRLRAVSVRKPFGRALVPTAELRAAA